MKLLFKETYLTQDSILNYDGNIQAFFVEINRMHYYYYEINGITISNNNSFQTSSSSLESTRLHTTFLSFRIDAQTEDVELFENGQYSFVDIESEPGQARLKLFETEWEEYIEKVKRIRTKNSNRAKTRKMRSD